MTPARFRQLALALPEAEAGAHQDHPDFRLRRKIFATLAPDGLHGVLKLLPDQQREQIALAPEVFSAVPGGWGEKGYTRVLLKKAKKAEVAPAMALAWLNVAPKTLARRYQVD